MSKAEYEEYFAWRKSVERSDFFNLKDDGLIDRITGKIEEIFASMPQFLKYGRKQLAELIEDINSTKKWEEKKMSLADKLAKHNNEYQKALARCEAEHAANQAKAVIAEFDKISKALAERKAGPVVSNSKELKSALDKLKEAYDSGNDIVKVALEDKISKISKEYEKQVEAEAQANATLQLELLWNSSNGDKELIIPVRWDSRLNKNSLKEHSIAEKLYEAAIKAVLGYDVECTEEEWCGYTKIVSKNVAGKKAEGLEPKEFVISLSSQTLTEQIEKEISKELQDANISLSIINTIIKAVPGKEYGAQTRKKAPKEKKEDKREQSAISQEELSDICHQVASMEDAAKLLDVDMHSVAYKIAKGAIHGFQYGPKKMYSIPVHDLITYMTSHPRTGLTGHKARKFEADAKDLTADDFAKYKSDVGEVLTVQEAQEFLGIGHSTVHMWLNNGRMHGVKHQNSWYVPKIELELCKKLYLSK
ncbi:MAG: helix-turn-helix domain-containing protein [Candidatus Woesearchaeota archaeon]